MTRALLTNQRIVTSESCYNWHSSVGWSLKNITKELEKKNPQSWKIKLDFKSDANPIIAMPVHAFYDMLLKYNGEKCRNDIKSGFFV